MVKYFRDQYTRKFREFELSGLKRFAKYLVNQKARSIKNDNKGPYERYMEKEIARNDRKIKKCESILQST